MSYFSQQSRNVTAQQIPKFSPSFYVEVVIKYEAPFFKYGIYTF